MDIMENSGPDGDQLKQLQRALFYESQFRNAIVADAVSFYDANITRDVIESDFFSVMKKMTSFLFRIILV